MYFLDGVFLENICGRQGECLLVCFFFLRRNPAVEEQQRKLLCPLCLWLGLLATSLFKASHSLSLRRSASGDKSQTTYELAEGFGSRRPWCVFSGATGTGPAPLALRALPVWSLMQVPGAACGLYGPHEREGLSRWRLCLKNGIRHMLALKC